jgi:methylphosphotriester-DNA--protein-cysteine methyltransferase
MPDSDEPAELQIRRLEQAVRALTFRNYELQQHIEDLAEQVADAHEHIHQMSMTKGWRTLEAMRKATRRSR